MDLEVEKAATAVVSVWGHNLQREFAAMEATIMERSCLYVAIDTEFPGCLYKSTACSPQDAYDVVRANVDTTKIIQLGMAVSDGSSSFFAWEFNFKNFDPSSDAHSPDSVVFLKDHGIDFEENRREGVDVEEFACLMRRSRLVGDRTSIRWITFHGQYDFAYLVDILRGRLRLPETLAEFMDGLEMWFGKDMYDVKYILRHCGDGGLHSCGLEKIARILNVERVAGRAHNAGSDSLLTCHVFFAVHRTYFDSVHNIIIKHKGILFGLEYSPPSPPPPHPPCGVHRIMLPPAGLPPPTFVLRRIVIGPPLFSAPSSPMSAPLASPRPPPSRPPTSSSPQAPSSSFAVQGIMMPPPFAAPSSSMSPRAFTCSHSSPRPTSPSPQPPVPLFAVRRMTRPCSPLSPVPGIVMSPPPPFHIPYYGQ